MPAWLGVMLTAAFVLVAVHRTVWRDAPGAPMAVGMAVMSLGMGRIGPMLVRCPWWALVFVLVAVWPVVRPVVAPVLRPALARVPLFGTECAGPVCGGPLAHLLGGVAMVYMCALPIAGAMAGMSEPTDGAATDRDLPAAYPRCQAWAAARPPAWRRPPRAPHSRWSAGHWPVTSCWAPSPR